jgi:hypothetical protein
MPLDADDPGDPVPKIYCTTDATRTDGKQHFAEVIRDIQTDRETTLYTTPYFRSFQLATANAAKWLRKHFPELVTA